VRTRWKLCNDSLIIVQFHYFFPAMKHTRSAVVLVVDRLGAQHLGPYGNTWFDTPALNRLASESVLFQYMLADSPQLEKIYRSYWQGLHGSCTADKQSRSDLIQLLHQAGCSTSLLTDEPLVAKHPLTGKFDQCLAATPQSVSQAAADVAQTEMAHLLAAAIDQFNSIHSTSLLWIHSRGMNGPWDAPTDLRMALVDEEDPPPGDFIQPPLKQFNKRPDPDELLGYTQAYAGQVMALDMCIEAFLDALSDSPAANDTLLILTSPRGYPLGEHGRVGPCDNALYAELLHIPLLIRFPDRHRATQRCHALVQPADLFSTLSDWFGVSHDQPLPHSQSLPALLENKQLSPRDRICSVSDGQFSLRTQSWFLRQAKDRRELYAKPDDRWEVNEVSDRCGEVAEQMAKAANLYLQAADTGGELNLPDLPDVLVSGLD